MTAPPEQHGAPDAAEEERRYRVARGLDVRSPSDLALLMECLGDPSWRVRAAASQVLSSAPDQGLVVPHLVAALGSAEGVGRRNAAAQALVALGPGAMPALVEALSSPLPELRTGAAEILGEIGDRRAVAPLRACLADPDANARLAAAEAIAKVGGPEAQAALSAALESGDEQLLLASLDGLARLESAPPVGRLVLLAQVRSLRRAAYRLAAWSDEPAAAELLAHGLADASRAARDASLGAVGQQRLRRAPSDLAPLARAVRAAASAVPSLAAGAAAALAAEDVAIQAGALTVLEWVADARHAPAVARAAEDERLRPLASEALVAIGPPLGDALAPVLATLSPGARTAALGALARVGDRGVLPALAQAAASDDEEARVAAIESLGRLGDLRALEALRPLLDHPDAAVSGAAVAALARLAGCGEEARRAVLESCRPTSGSASAACYRLLGRAGGDEDLPTLRAGLRAPHRGARVSAMGAVATLASRGLLATERPPELLDALDDADAAVRAAAAQAIGSLLRSGGSAWPEAERGLLLALRDEDGTSRAAAATALGRRGAREHAGPLGRLAADPTCPAEAAAAAVHGLAEIGDPDPEVLHLAAAHPDHEVVKEAVRAAVGVAGPAGASLLVAALEHPRWDVRRAAALALGERGEAPLLEALRRRAASEDDALVAEALAQAVRTIEGRG